MAYATIAIMNWNVTGSIGRRLPQVEAPFQACISIGKRATIRRHEFPDTASWWSVELLLSSSRLISDGSNKCTIRGCTNSGALGEQSSGATRQTYTHCMTQQVAMGSKVCGPSDPSAHPTFCRLTSATLQYGHIVV